MSEKIDIRSEAFRVQESENEEGEDEVVIEGVALPYNKESRNGIVYTKESIQEAAKSLEGKPFLFNHNPDQVLGRVTEATPKKNHLAFKAVADPTKEKVRDIKNGYVSTVSIQAVVEESEEDGEGKVAVKEFLELSSAPIPGFKEAEAQAQAVRIEEFDMEQRENTIIREPEVEGGQDSRWDPQDKEDFSSESNYFEAHAVWFKEEPQQTDDVAFEIARENEGKLEVNYNALNSAYDLAETDNDLGSDDIMKLRSLLEDLREEWFEDKESLDADNSEEKKSKEPFAGYDDFDDCVSQNQDKQDPEAYCATIKKKVEEIDTTGESNMSDEDTEQEQDIEDLGDALDWLDANAPDEVINMIQDAMQEEDDMDDDEEEESNDEESEEQFTKIEERLDELEEKLESEEVSESKQPDAGSDDSEISEESLANELRKKLRGDN